MNDIEELGGPLDHLSEKGLKQLVRNLQSKLRALEKRVADYEKEFETRGYAFQEAIQKSLIKVDRYEKALKEISDKHFQCEDEPWCISQIAEEALGNDGGETK